MRARRSGGGRTSRWNTSVVRPSTDTAMRTGSKPANILVETVDGKPVPKIIDFGIAKALDEGPGQPLVTRRGQLIGTPGYMSPEQVRGLDIDTRADIYALGAVL